MDLSKILRVILLKIKDHSFMVLMKVETPLLDPEQEQPARVFDIGLLSEVEDNDVSSLWNHSKCVALNPTATIGGSTSYSNDSNAPCTIPKLPLNSNFELGAPNLKESIGKGILGLSPFVTEN